MCGVTRPDSYTLRELYYMLDGKRREAWDHTAYLVMSIAKIIGNDNCKFEDFHPYLEIKKHVKRNVPIKQLPEKLDEETKLLNISTRLNIPIEKLKKALAYGDKRHSSRRGVCNS